MLGSQSRNAHARARLIRLDADGALEQSGVVAVLGIGDVPGEGDSGANKHDEPLFPCEVSYHSQPVAWVLGETLDAAKLGAARVSAEYDPLPPVLTIRQAIEAGSFHSGPFRIQRGDAAAEIASSPYRLAAELEIGGQEHFYLEGQVALAWIDEGGAI